MSWSRRQYNGSQTSTPATSATCSFSGTVYAGDIVVVAVATDAVMAGAPSIALSDNYSNTYSLACSKAFTSGVAQALVAIYSATIATSVSGLAVTASSGTSQNWTLAVLDYDSGTSVTLDSTNEGTGTGTSLSSGNVNVSGNDLAVGVGFSIASSNSWTAGSGFGLVYSQAGDGAGPLLSIAVVDALNLSSGPVDPSVTSTVSGQWSMCGATFTTGMAIDFATASVTESHDSFAGHASFASIASMAKTEGHDVFAGSGHFQTTGSIARTEGHDTAAISAGFKSIGSMAAAEHRDAFAGSASELTATMARTEGHDAFAGTARFTAGTTLAGLNRNDAFASWAFVSPYMRATEHHDAFSASATFTGVPPATMAATEGHDAFSGSAGFTFDSHGSLSPTEGHDEFSALGTRTTAGAMVAVESGDHFAAEAGFRSIATLATVERHDWLFGGDTYPWYHVYSNTGHGDPINYNTPIDTTSTLTYTTAPLSYPGTWSFGVRAFDVYGEEQNVDCAVTFILDSTGHDITSRPAPPTGLRAFATAGGGIRAEWGYATPAIRARTPTGFHAYIAAGAMPSYATPVATVLYSASVAGTFAANLSGLSNGVSYAIGVRAYNATAEEANTTVVTCVAVSVGPTAVESLTAVAST